MEKGTNEKTAPMGAVFCVHQFAMYLVVGVHNAVRHSHGEWTGNRNLCRNFTH